MKKHENKISTLRSGQNKTDGKGTCAQLSHVYIICTDGTTGNGTAISAHVALQTAVPRKYKMPEYGLVSKTKLEGDHGL